MRHYNIINGMEMDKYQICVSFGNSIKVWDFDTERVKESKKKNKTSRELLSLKLARNKNIMEDYRTSCEMLEKEKNQEKMNSKNFKRFNGSINEELTEEELMAYAMMLSMDQKEQVVSSSSNINENEVDDDFEYDPSQFESDQEEIPEDYVDEQEKKDFLFASELAKQDMYMEKISNEINHPEEEHFDDQYYEDDGEEEHGISAEQYFKEEKIKQEERKKKNNANKSKPTFNTSNKSDNDFINDAIQDFLNDTTVTSTTNAVPPSNDTTDISTGKFKNKYDDIEEAPKSKGKKGKNKKNKGKKKNNFIPLDEWEENHDSYPYEKDSISSQHPDNSITKDIADMDEEEYLNYVLQLSLHDK